MLAPIFDGCMPTERHLELARFIRNNIEILKPIPFVNNVKPIYTELMWSEVLARAVTLGLVSPEVQFFKHFNYIRDGMLIVWKAQALVSNI